MQPTYQNSKGESVVIAEMELKHLIFAMCKNARALGEAVIDDFTKDQKTNEIKHMQEDIMRRFGEAYVPSFVPVAEFIQNFNSEAFQATVSEITEEESRQIARKCFENSAQMMMNGDLDGLMISEELDQIRAAE